MTLGDEVYSGRFCWIAVLWSLSPSSFTHSSVLNYLTHEIVLCKLQHTWCILLENLRSGRLTEELSLDPTRTIIALTSTFTLTTISHKIVFWILCAVTFSFSFFFNLFLFQFKNWLFILRSLFEWFRFPNIIIFFMNIMFKLKEDLLIKCLKS